MEPMDVQRKCITEHPKLLRMSLRHGEGWALHGLIRALRPQTIVEIGRLAGVSSSWILTAIDGNEKGHLDSIDIKTMTEAVLKLDKWAKSGTVTIHEFCSHGSQSAALAEKLGTVDFLFVDGSHTPDAVEADCRLWLPRVRGYVLFHDWGFEGVRVGVRRVVDMEKFSRHIMFNEHMDTEQTHITSHGLMLLYLPEGLSCMPQESAGKPG